MTKEEYQAIYNYLSSLNGRHASAKRSSERNRIESDAFNYAKNLPFELYCELNDGAANGLFRHGHSQGFTGSVHRGDRDVRADGAPFKDVCFAL